MKNCKEVFTTVAVVGLMSGCAGTQPFADPDVRVVNPPKNRGIQEYASAACRAAGISPVPGHNVRASNPRFHAFLSDPKLAPYIKVTSVNGVPYTLVPQHGESVLFTRLGAATGAVTAGELASKNRNRTPIERNLGRILGAVAGSALGSAGDGVLNGAQREAADRCRADVLSGAYDPPRATQEPPRPLAPGHRSQDYGY